MDNPLPANIIEYSQLFVDELFSMQNIILFSIILLFMICSALVSGSEIAFFSFKTDDLAQFESSKDKRETTIYNLVNQPRYLLATILIANNFFNIGIIISSFYLLKNLFNFSGFPIWTEVVVNSVIVTFLIVLFGEVIPKVYATQKGASLARFMATPLTIAKKLLLPFSKLLTKTTSRMEARMVKNEDSISAEEVDLAIDITTKGKATEEEVQMLKSIVRFGEISVNDVMTSRPDVKAVPNTLSFQHLIQFIKKSGFSRIPVYKEDLDTIEGVLYAKDLLQYLEYGDDFDWTTLLRETFFVPENKKIDDLLEDFQTNRMHIAIVVDEYGGTAGLITLEDVLEEIIGEIKDEFDDLTANIAYEKIDENKYVFEGKVSLFDMCKLIDANFNEFEAVKGEADSLAGLLLEIAGKIPKRNQQVKFQNYVFTVLEVDSKRIKKIDVERFELD